MITTAASAAHALKKATVPVASGRDDDGLVDQAGTAQVALIGEASRGTHEFYETRAAHARQLIEERGFCMVALEADWPNNLRVHRYVTGRAQEQDATAALGDFRRFPAWMWRDTVMVAFVEWLRRCDKTRAVEPLERVSVWDEGELPETYPEGF